ncbi:hypothetical protein ECG_04552 [Echinococcus granulosus]|uniref:Neuropeptides capa receptor n=2 Tax=Echinococcus granulosus TaxID=6210 RepID=A0A068WBT4_ECHGR|nr:hypothetical protein ECG_04552 [Echinococcus granulosus]CDS17161.1 neuropeptides capa receptor [Echinococcus granulosus]
MCFHEQNGYSPFFKEMFELATQFAGCHNSTFQNHSNAQPSENIILFLTYAQPVVAVVGIVGNIFVITLLNAASKETACILYLRCLAVFDCISITAFQCSFYPLMVLKVYLMTRYGSTFSAIDIYFSKPGVCQITEFVSFTSRTLSTWTVVMFTIERLIVVVWPLHAIKCFTLRRSQFHILLSILISLLINMPWFFALETVQDPCGTGEFVCRPNEVLNINRIFEVLFLSVLPATIICSCNAVILHKIRNHRRPGAEGGQGGCVGGHPGSGQSVTHSSTTRQLLAVSFCFVVLTLPSAVINVVQTFNHFLDTLKDFSGSLADTYYIAWFLFMINLSSNFFVYCLVRRTFRKAALRLFRRKYGHCSHQNRASTLHIAQTEAVT